MSSNVLSGSEFTCIVPKGIPFMIASSVKTKLATNSDPAIVKFGQKVDNHFVEKFLNFMNRHDGQTFTPLKWQMQLALFKAKYFDKLPPVVCMMFSMQFPDDVIDKSLKAIICDTC